MRKLVLTGLIAMASLMDMMAPALPQSQKPQEIERGSAEGLANKPWMAEARRMNELFESGKIDAKEFARRAADIRKRYPEDFAVGPNPDGQ